MQSAKYTLGRWTPDFIFDPDRKQWLRRVWVVFPLPKDFDWPPDLGRYLGVGHDSHGDCGYFELTLRDMKLAKVDAKKMGLPAPTPENCAHPSEPLPPARPRRKAKRKEKQ